MIDANVHQSKISNVAAAYILGKVSSSLNEFNQMESIDIVRGLFGIKEEQPSALQITEYLIKTIGEKNMQKIRDLLTDQGVSGVIWRFVSSKMFMVELSKVLDNQGNFLSLTLITVSNENTSETNVRELVRFNSKGVEYLNKKIRSIDYDDGVVGELKSIRSETISSLEAKVLNKDSAVPEETIAPEEIVEAVKEDVNEGPVLGPNMRIELTHNGVQAKEIYNAAVKLLEKKLPVAQINEFLDELKNQTNPEFEWSAWCQDDVLFITAMINTNSAPPVKKVRLEKTECVESVISDYFTANDASMMASSIQPLLMESLGEIEITASTEEIVEKSNGILHEKTIKDCTVVGAKIDESGIVLEISPTPEYLETAKVHFDELIAKQEEEKMMKEVILKNGETYIYKLTGEEDEFEFQSEELIPIITGTDPDCGAFTDGGKYIAHADVTRQMFADGTLVSVMENLDEVVEIPKEEVVEHKEEEMEEPKASREIIVSSDLEDIKETIVETLNQILDEDENSHSGGLGYVTQRLCDITDIENLAIEADSELGWKKLTVSQEEESDEEDASETEDVDDSEEENIPSDIDSSSNGIDINDRNYQMSLFEGLFQTKDPAITHVERFLRNFHSENRTQSFLATMGTIPFQTPIVYDDVTICFVKFKNGLFYRIYIAKTDPSLGRDGHGWVESRNVPGRWVQVGSDIQAGPNRNFRGRRY